MTLSISICVWEPLAFSVLWTIFPAHSLLCCLLCSCRRGSVSPRVSDHGPPLLAGGRLLGATGSSLPPGPLYRAALFIKARKVESRQSPLARWKLQPYPILFSGQRRQSIIYTVLSRWEASRRSPSHVRRGVTQGVNTRKQGFTGSSWSLSTLGSSVIHIPPTGKMHLPPLKFSINLAPLQCHLEVQKLVI